MYPRPTRPPDEADVLIGKLEEARAGGLEVTFDLTMFPRGGGAWVQGLPGWARDGGHDATAMIIRDRAGRARLIEALAEPDPESWATDWDDQVICKVNSPANEHLFGRTIGEIARERGQAPVDTALDLVLEDGQFWVAPTIEDQRHLDRLIASPLCVPIGDGFLASPGPTSRVRVDAEELRDVPVGDGLLRGTARCRSKRPCTRSPRSRRDVSVSPTAVLQPGWPRISLFDPAAVANRATEADPSARPAGVSRVMVNGRWVVADGAATGERPGGCCERSADPTCRRTSASATCGATTSRITSSTGITWPARSCWFRSTCPARRSIRAFRDAQVVLPRRRVQAPAPRRADVPRPRERRGPHGPHGRGAPLPGRHYGYNFGAETVEILVAFAPLPDDITAAADISKLARPLEGITGGRYDLLGGHPWNAADARGSERIRVLRPADWLELIHGTVQPVRSSFSPRRRS